MPEVSIIKVFPNPSSGRFTISIADNLEIPFSILVKNVLGQTILENKDLKSHEITFDLSEVVDGNYFIEIQNNSFTSVKKISVEK